MPVYLSELVDAGQAVKAPALGGRYQPLGAPWGDVPARSIFRMQGRTTGKILLRTPHRLPNLPRGVTLLGEDADERLASSSKHVLAALAHDGRVIKDGTLRDALAALMRSPLSGSETPAPVPDNHGRLTLRLGSLAVLDEVVAPARHASVQFADNFGGVAASINGRTLPDGPDSGTWAAAGWNLSGSGTVLGSSTTFGIAFHGGVDTPDMEGRIEFVTASYPAGGSSALLVRATVAGQGFWFYVSQFTLGLYDAADTVVLDTVIHGEDVSSPLSLYGSCNGSSFFGWLSGGHTVSGTDGSNPAEVRSGMIYSPDNVADSVAVDSYLINDIGYGATVATRRRSFGFGNGVTNI